MLIGSRSRIRFSIGLMIASLVLVGCTLSTRTSNLNPHLGTEITVFRSPTCGCCGKWIEHMEAAGFQVTDQITEDMDVIKQQYAVPDTLSACHTAVVNDYVIEGHIPAQDVLQLLDQTPDVAGIAVPGMPIGSPGMESGDYIEPYTVFSFTEEGSTEAFSEHS